MTEPSQPAAPFVVLEGPNAVGKTLTTAALTRRLKRRGIDVLATVEPTDTPFGRAVRNSEARLRGRSLALAVAADRDWHARHEIEPALAAGRWVISDRCFPSSLVLQVADGVPAADLWEMFGGLRIPDLTIFLEAESHQLAARLRSRGRRTRLEDSDEGREVERYREVRLELAERGWLTAAVTGPNEEAVLEGCLAALRHLIS